jgi:dTDP-4-dehydrorhamnose 3,5-epimerase
LRFHETTLPGAYVVELDLIADDRGAFARCWCFDEFAAHGLCSSVVQCSLSYNRRCGTLRGLHFQEPPHAEIKLVRCVRGAAYDVLVDLRPDSPTFLRWFAVELSADNGKAAYIPAGFAHGFQTLADETDLLYQMSECYHPQSARGVRWNDPRINIAWPIPEPILSARDAALPLFAA